MTTAPSGVKEHVIGKDTFHFKWDHSLPPAVEIQAGEVVRFETEEVTAGQLKKGDPAARLGELDFDRLYPLGGPVYVHGAMPGDVLEVEILELKTGAWGWAAILPGLGLLQSDFTDPYVRYFDLEDRTSAELRHDIHIPIAPFCGTMGVATDEPGAHDVLPPTKGAGNIDTRHLTAGARLYLPVFVPGALFSAGDCHAAQGDGEVCVTGIECPMTFSLRFGVVKGGSLRPWSYHFVTPAAPLQPRSDAAGYHAVTALGPDLMENARNAVRDTIGWLVADHGLSREDAYVLCSLAGDLRISQIVDQPNFGVSFYLPLTVFT
ncbi:MAG TPA: acetamidase/formamidase family protein [Candidatus Dormibacteraeota bacterium]|nr:acetamidase/formamidase family protein [Candidatus Dormibacteraeota bacterium]